MGGQEGGKKEAVKKGKKKRTGKKHSSPKIYKFYDAKGSELARVRKACPRCGPGVFLAAHKNRDYCGKCGYTVTHVKK